MISIAVTLVALGFGIYLLILIKVNDLEMWYKVVAWLFIAMALGYNLCLVARGIEYHQQVKDIVIERPYLK
jgi:hypothetical protein